MNATTRNSLLIDASPNTLYRAFTDPEALPQWLAPGEMTAQVHDFDGRVGGGYGMSLFGIRPEDNFEGTRMTLEKLARYIAR